MNIKDFFKNKPTFKRTTKYKNNQELTTKEYVNELVYSFGQIYLYVGLSDCFDDIYYILIDSNGTIHYHSCVGELGTPLLDYMTDDKYKKFKQYFISSIKYQRNWRISWDNGCYLPESNDNLEVEYYNQNGLPIIKELKTNIKDYYKCHLSKDEKKKIKKEFWNYFWHIFGLHHIGERCYEYDEVKAIKDEENYDSVLTGICTICKHKIKISEGWISNWSFWYKHKWLWFICKPVVTFLDTFKRAK